MFDIEGRLCELIKDSKKHDEKQEKRFDKIETSLKECPESTHIEKQNGKIDTLIESVGKLTLRSCWKKELTKDAVRYLLLIISLFGAVIGYAKYTEHKEAAMIISTGTKHRAPTNP